jgi:hypothetical protein
MRSSSSLCGKGSMIVVKQPISTTSRAGERQCGRAYRNRAGRRAQRNNPPTITP